MKIAVSPAWYSELSRILGIHWASQRSPFCTWLSVSSPDGQECMSSQLFGVMNVSDADRSGGSESGTSWAAHSEKMLGTSSRCEDGPESSEMPWVDPEVRAM